jgi:hypothetical protein
MRRFAIPATALRFAWGMKDPLLRLSLAAPIRLIYVVM